MKIEAILHQAGKKVNYIKYVAEEPNQRVEFAAHTSQDARRGDSEPPDDE